MLSRTVSKCLQIIGQLFFFVGGGVRVFNTR